MTLLAVVIAFALFHWVHKPDWMTSFSFINDFDSILHDKIGVNSPPARFVLILAFPIVLLALALEFLNVSAFHNGNQITQLLLHILILFLCLGPEPIETSLENGDLFKQLNITQKSSTKTIINNITDAALHRWFGVFFWYLILGLWGAVLYRLVSELNQPKNGNPVYKAWTLQIIQLLNFPPIMVMTLSLAVATDFEKIWAKCKPYFKIETITGLNCQYLYDAMYHAVEHDELKDSNNQNDAQQDINKPDKSITVVTDTLKVLKRMLAACLVFIALLVIFSAR